MSDVQSRALAPEDPGNQSPALSPALCGTSGNLCCGNLPSLENAIAASLPHGP